MIDRRYLIHGVLPAVTASLCFAGMSTLVKFAATDTPSQVLVFLRALFGFLFVLPFALRHGVGFLKTTRTRLHIVRAAVSVCALSCFYFAVSRIGLGEAILLNASSPLFIGVFAIFMLNERLGQWAAIALVIGFVGVVFILRPDGNIFQLGALIGAMSGLFVALGKIFIRQLADTEPVIRTVFYFGLYSSLMCLVPLIWLWQTPTVFSLSCMVVAAAFATLGQTVLTYAFSHNRAASVAPFSYITVVLGGFAGWLFWEEIPSVATVMGGALVIGACITMTLSSNSSASGATDKAGGLNRGAIKTSD